MTSACRKKPKVPMIVRRSVKSNPDVMLGRTRKKATSGVIVKSGLVRPYNISKSVPIFIFRWQWKRNALW